MKNQGVVKFFAVALVLMCIYQLSFTFRAMSIESEAKEEAQGNPEIERRYLDSMGPQKVYNLLFKNFTYLEVKDRQLNLGLDLQGGMNVVMEISQADIIRALANNANSPEFNRALDSASSARMNNPELNMVEEFRRQYNAIAPNMKLSALFYSKEN
ncbi:MAG TPA: protein translocase subunit SecDF, partial [Bacteroidia bacterium]|nr:protein translocase subunit SecDF [Bacteroidia bacterium]